MASAAADEQQRDAEPPDVRGGAQREAPVVVTGGQLEQRPHRGTPPRAQDVVDVRLLGLVVEAERVHHQVDREPERLLALVVAARDDLVLPAAEAVARQRAAEIVLRVDDRQPAIALDPFELAASR